MKHILFFTDTPVFGGAERQMLLLAKFLNKEKYSISLFCISENLKEKFEEDGIKVFKIKTFGKNDPRIFFKFKKILRRDEPDLIHFNLWNPASCRFSLLAAKKSKIPYIITEHDPFKLNRFKTFIKRKIIGDPKAVIALSKENAEFLRNEYREITNNIKVVRNGIDFEAFRKELLRFTMQDRERFRKEFFNAKPEDIVITNIATLHERKGQKFLIEALKSVKKKYSNAKLVFVGSGPEFISYKKFVQKMELGLDSDVVFLGERYDIPQILVSSDLFVLPSIREAFGLVLLEAGAIPLPVIATNTGGIPEIIENGKEGLLVASADSEALARAIFKLLDNENLMNSLKKALYEKISQKFQAKIMAENTERIYDEILKDQPLKP